MLSPIDLAWSHVLNIILQTYLSGSTICIFWHKDYEFRPQQQANASDFFSYVGINHGQLAASNLTHNVIDFDRKLQDLRAKELPCDDLLLKLTLSIEASHCEDIAHFVAAFNTAAMYSIWRSTNNRFVFAHEADFELDEVLSSNVFFQDQPNILFVQRSNASATAFELKTNKYVGPRKEHPEQLVLLDRYDVLTRRFEFKVTLFPYKLADLQGREVVIVGFDYRPYTIIDYRQPSNARDVGVSADSNLANVYIDGTETRLVLNFCEQYNCTVQIDTSDANDWGTIYPNMSGDGAMGMVIYHKADICIGSMYSWYEDYVYLDMSMYLVRSGITCLVPAPHRLASWYLPLQPFQDLLWAAVMLCMLIELLSLLLAYRGEQLLYANTSGSWWLSFKFGLGTTFKLFISQSNSNKIYSVFVRVLLFACFLNDLVITSIYGGGLASILTIPSLSEPADTLERLHTHQLKWAANSEAWVLAMRGSDDALVQSLLSRFSIYSDEQLLKLTEQASMGFTVERLPFGHFAIGDHLTQAAVERMKIMQEDLYYQYTVAFVPRLWPLLENFNKLIYNWHSSGFDKYWEYRVVANYLNGHIQQQVESSMTSSGESIGPVKLGMSNFVGILLVWVLGITTVTCVFIAELIVFKCRK